jgi:hypothetical protein
MFVEVTRTVAASADTGIVGSQARIEIQIVTRHCRWVDQRWYLMTLEPRRFGRRLATPLSTTGGACVRAAIQVQAR